MTAWARLKWDVRDWLRSREWYRRLVGGWWEARFCAADHELSWWPHTTAEADETFFERWVTRHSEEMRHWWSEHNPDLCRHADATEARARRILAGSPFEGRTATVWYALAEFGPPWLMLLQINYSQRKQPRIAAASTHPYRAAP